VKDFLPPLFSRRLASRLKLRNHICAIAFALSLGTAHLCAQQSSKVSSQAGVSAAPKTAAIKSFRIIQEKTGQAVEILSTKPLVPAVQAITDPNRLVIDLPNARLDTQHKRISVQADQISAIRADQFQQTPPIARVVVDLLAPRSFTWESAGNRIVVHLGRSSDSDDSPFQAPTVTSLTSSPQPVVMAVRASGPLAIVGDPSIGSSITAGAETTVVRLSSGGEIHVCPRTTVSLTPSQSRHNLMLSMNTGAMEAHFALDASSDSVMTPDFRILLAGPGEFHYAISADVQGNTCVRALPGNTASAIVSELLGDRTYQVKATDQLVFRSGQLDRVDMAVPLECGCPPPREPPSRAVNVSPKQNKGAVRSTEVAPGPPEEIARNKNEETPAANPLDASAAPNELHVQVEAPFVFHAQGPPPAPVEDVSALPFSSRAGTDSSLAASLPPPANPAPPPDTGSAKQTSPPGFFKKVGGFFAALFR